MNYWLVGAAWGGIDHQDTVFLENGYWMLGWDKDDQPSQFEKGELIKVGDRIAIKKMKGQGAKDIRICHIGIVKGVVFDSEKIVCIVDWVAKDLDRSVDAHGCFQSIHGPYKQDAYNGWIKEIFCL